MGECVWVWESVYGYGKEYWYGIECMVTGESVWVRESVCRSAGKIASCSEAILQASQAAIFKNAPDNVWDE